MRKGLYAISLFCLSLIGVSFSFAQSQAPVRTPLPAATLPLPFAYPSGFMRPTIDRDEHIGAEVSLGDFDVILGQTKLSTVVQTLGGELQFTPSRAGFLCYSAPLIQKNSKGQTKEAQFPRQNIWLMLGSRGEISEARAVAVSEGQPLCPALSLEYSTVKFGPIYIKEPVRDIEKDKNLEPSEKPEGSDWIFWFSQKPAPNKKMQIGLFGAQKDNGVIDKIISVVETVKGF